MKSREVDANGLDKKQVKYLTLIDNYLLQIKGMRKDLQRTKAEIGRLKVSSRRKLAEIDDVLSRV
jgi:hypothetical protein